ncbi:MAG TPA: RIP metalloprotease RseP [Candidatus Angelobacter sp.]
MQVLIYLAAVALVLGVLVFVHEFGHYAVAKLCGVRVEVFSLGFGKRLWGFRKGDTDYRISLLPLGGYVKMAGENPMEERTGDPGEFTSHPRWQRFLIAIAGPSMNIILAIVVLAVVFMVRFGYPVYWKKPADIGWVRPDSRAQAAGIRPGDRILKIDNISNPTWEDLEYRIALNPNQSLPVVLQRGSQIISNIILTPKPTGPEQEGSAGLEAVEPVHVATVEQGLPAENSGIQPGDQIVAVNGEPLRDFQQMYDTVQQAKATPVSFTFLHDNKQSTVTLTPQFTTPENSQEKQYLIGISRTEEREITSLSLGPAIVQSLAECKKNSLLIFELLQKMVQHKVSIRQMSGPIGITKMSGEAAKQGVIPLLALMALISLNLAVFNLLPIPILDGGLMLMLAIEGIMRRDIKQEIKERVYRVAFVFLLVFAAVVIYNDLAKTLPGHLL